MFFVVSGADGVGKSTVIEACRELLLEEKISVFKFHHIQDTKVSVPSAGKKRAAHFSVSSIRPRYKMLVPTRIKSIISALIDEYRYAKNIRNILLKCKKSGELALCDRYIYDRNVALKMRNRPIEQRLAVWISCCIIRRPTLTFVLVDDPVKIRDRKPELTLEEIEAYPNSLIKVYSKVGAASEQVKVNGRMPDAIASDLLKIILTYVRAE